MRRSATLLIASLVLIATAACEAETSEPVTTTIQAQATTAVETTTTAPSEESTSTTARPLVDPGLEATFVEFVRESWVRSGRDHGSEVPDLTGAFGDYLIDSAKDPNGATHPGPGRRSGDR